MSETYRTKEEIQQMTTKQDAEISFIVDSIIQELTGRRGLRHVWEEIDEDTRAEIKNNWMQIINEGLSTSNYASESVRKLVKKIVKRHDNLALISTVHGMPVEPLTDSERELLRKICEE